eukprot:1174115-Prorocentrum_minimum.AAC.1
MNACILCCMVWIGGASSHQSKATHNILVRARRMMCAARVRFSYLPQADAVLNVEDERELRQIVEALSGRIVE